MDRYVYRVCREARKNSPRKVVVQNLTSKQKHQPFLPESLRRLPYMYSTSKTKNPTHTHAVRQIISRSSPDTFALYKTKCWCHNTNVLSRGPVFLTQVNWLDSGFQHWVTSHPGLVLKWRDAAHRNDVKKKQHRDERENVFKSRQEIKPAFP